MAEIFNEEDKAFYLFLMASSAADSSCLGGSLCRNSFSCNSQYRREADAACVKLLFAEYDSDKDGYITLDEAHTILHLKFGLPPEPTRKIMLSCVTSSDGQLTFREFAAFYGKVKQKIKEIKTIFDEFDSNHDGFVTADDAKRSMTRMGFNPTEVDALVTIHDVNKDGRLEYDDFVRFWLSR